MWDQGSQPWQQWPLSQQQWMQSFQQQQDPSQIDWAALAQAWIAQREASEESAAPQQPVIIPNGQAVHGIENSQENHGSFPGDPNFNRMWEQDWGMQHHRPPPPPPDQQWIPTPAPMDIVPPSEDNSQDSGEFAPDSRRMFNQVNNNNFGGAPENFGMGSVPVSQFDYQHGAAFGPPGGFHPPYWQPGPPPNRRDRPAYRDRPRSPVTVKQDPPALDAVKRRTLPAWIREGLEKMEREKQKKLEKERLEKERAQSSKHKKDTEDVPGEADGPRLPHKSKFDSDDEEEYETTETKSSDKQSRSPSPVAQEEQSEPEMTEEEKEFQMMIMMKMLLTEVLLEVTNEEIYYVAREAHRKATKGLASLNAGKLSEDLFLKNVSPTIFKIPHKIKILLFLLS
ncbi:arginine/serine-rich protein PNISR isoform X3 [Hypanus sabinus]|uniref:arginine/serine-rich protein PNISR isoform X3 n=1 Tax=Hypanus sabinus TaxID=79690 RepID=UPI0028C3FCF3|nr:arginine/serine-rich protein PNISR isoform X3 [Hypanus sabinus]